MAHSPWSALKKSDSLDPRMWEVMWAHTQGYIKALEDVLNDLSKQHRSDTVVDIMLKVRASLQSAIRTREAFDRMIKNDKGSPEGPPDPEDQGGVSDPGAVCRDS